MRLARVILLFVILFSIIIPLKAQDKHMILKEYNQVSKSLDVNAEMMDINRVGCYFFNDGTFGRNPQTGGNGCYFPSGQEERSVIYSAGLWVLGKVQVDTLRFLYSCASYYRGEFQPGIMLTDSTADSPGEDKYMVYKYAQGDTIHQDALDQGCPDEILGNQMLFSVYNDFRSEGFLWNPLAIGLEVQQTSFAWEEDFGLGHTIFSRYRIFNKGKFTLDTAYVAIWLDPDVGYALDDLAGSDSTRGLIFAYNGDEYDDVYGSLVPAVGCDLLQGPIVEAAGETVVLPDGTVFPDSKILGMTASFVNCEESSIAGMQDPANAEDAYNYVQGLRTDGKAWLDPTQGDAPTPFPFAGDPVAGTGWLLESVSDPNDVKMGLATGPFTMAPGDSQDIVIALVVAQGPDPVNSIAVLKDYDADAQLTYESDFDVVASAEKIAYVPQRTTLSQNYPNPFNPSTTIQFSLSKPGFVTLNVYNVLGKRIASLVKDRLNVGEHTIEWSPENLSSGIYFYQLTTGETVLTQKLLFQK